MRRIFVTILLAMFICYALPSILTALPIPVLLFFVDVTTPPQMGLTSSLITSVGNVAILIGYLLSFGMLCIAARRLVKTKVLYAVGLQRVSLRKLPLLSFYFCILFGFLIALNWPYIVNHRPYQFVWDNYLIILFANIILSEITIRGFLYRVLVDWKNERFAIMGTTILAIIPALISYWHSVSNVFISGPYIAETDYRGIIAILFINSLLSLVRAKTGSVYPTIILRLLTCTFSWFIP
jgi:hypothetical protein